MCRATRSATLPPSGYPPLNGLFTGTNFWHAVLGFIGCVPGPVGMVANLADAAVYALIDHDYGMAVLAMLDCASGGLSALGWLLTNTTSKDLYNPETRLRIRFDKGVEGTSGFEAVDHYHIYNGNYTNKKVDFYFDIDGNTVGKGSKGSHIVIGGGD